MINDNLIKGYVTNNKALTREELIE